MLLLVLLLFFLYIQPNIIIFLFTNIISILLFIIIIIIIGFYNSSFSFGLLMIFIIFIITINTSKEGYQSITWSKELIEKFIEYQYYHNPIYIFDMNIIQKQVSPKEAENYFKNGKWIWSPEIEEMYKYAILTNPNINYNQLSSLEQAQKIYNETAIKEILGWNSKEGNFILNGAVIGQSKHLPKNINNTIQCDSDGNMLKIINKNVDIYPGYMIQNKTKLSPEEIPKVLNGFKFINKPCNPCSNLYDCPFTLNVGDGGEISPIWSYLWKLNKNHNFNLNDNKNYNITTNY